MKKLQVLIITLSLMLAMGTAAFAGEAASVESAIATEDLFTSRDLEQTADLSDAESYTVSDGTDIHITEAGVYVLSGTATDVTVYVEAGEDDKVQLVLDGVSITNSSFSCIYVACADKVFVTTSADSSLSVTGAFAVAGGLEADGVIYSKTDLVMNGTAVLTMDSSENGIVTKDDLKVTGGTYRITAASKCLEANDSIRIADGTFELQAGSDGLHAENSDDGTLGYVYIKNGTFTINAQDDAIHGESIVQIDGGTFEITGAEGIEGTWIQINGGTIMISGGDDGINGGQKSDAYYATVEINGGELTIVMAAGDTDAIDCNGDLIINGGTIDITAASSFDFDGTGQLNGGTVIVNGQQLSALPAQMGMGGGFGGRGWH